MMMNKIVYLCVLGLLIGVGGGCRRNISSGGRSFSQNFDSDREEDLERAAKMYESLCQELESRAFRQVEMTKCLEIKSIHYKGEHDGFPLTVKIHCLLSISEEKPEFSYRVSFKETSAVGELNATAKDFRASMKAWCEI
jgi:hypothetical protein